MPTPDNPALYEKAKEIADQKYAKPSAYKSGFIVKTYKSMGGTYTDDKKPKNLKRWYKEDWEDVGNKEYPTYRPTKRVNKKTPLLASEIDPQNLKEQIALKQKIKGTKNLPKFIGGAISKSIQTRARKMVRATGEDYSEEDVERKAEELHQKYLANKEKASKRAEKREERALAKEHMITIPVLPEGSPEVDLPRYYAVEKSKNVKYKKKNGETVTKVEKSYKLVNPLTKQRNIAQRQGSKPITLKRKDVDEVAVENTIVKTIPLSKIVPEDQKKAFTYDRKRKKYDERGVAPKDRPDKSAFEVKERGRPELLPKNIYHHQNKGTSKLNEKLGKLRNPREPEETKEETYQEEEKDGYEPPPRPQDPRPQAKKKAGRPKKYSTEEEARKAKTAMTIESNRRRYQEKKDQLLKQVEKIKQLKISEREKEKRIQALDEQAERLSYAVTHPKQLPENPTPRGEGIVDSLKSGFSKAVGSIKDRANRFGNFLSQIVTGSTDYSPSVRKILEDEGMNLIKSIVVGRTPVQKAITIALNVVSQGKFKSNQDRLNYDKLFHLFTEITLEDGKKVRVEKNEVITMTIGFRQDADTERQEVPMTKVSFRDLLENARRKMKGKFFAYDSANNNCQDFIMALLQGSGLGTQENYEFIKQNTKQLFEKIPRTRAMAKQITNLGQRINIAKSGGKISSNTIMPKFAKGSQEARDHMAKIRGMRGMRGGATGNQVGARLGDNLLKLADAGTNKLIGMMGTGRREYDSESDEEMEGCGPKGLKKFNKWTGAIGDFLKPVAKPILEAGTQRAVEMIRGSGPKGLKKFNKWTGAIGDFLKPVAKPILEAGTQRAVQMISGSGMGDMMGSGVHIHHHHYTPHSYAEGGNLGYGLSYSGYGPSGRGIEGGSAEYGHHHLAGTGIVDDFMGKVHKLKIPKNPQEALQQLQLLQSLTPTGFATSQVAKMVGSGPAGLKKFNKWTGAIGNFLKPVAKPILEAGTQRAVQMIRGSGPKGLKKFNKWTGAIGDFLKPVAKPILEAGTQRAVQMIKGSGHYMPDGSYMDGPMCGKGSQAMKDKMARIRAMRKK